MSRSPLCVLTSLVAITFLAGADEPAEPVSFSRDVAPILVTHCLGCHDDQKAESGLNLSTFAGLMKGGDILPGESIVPGDPDLSYLIELVHPDAEPWMPYKLDPLPADDIATLERWVREGARFDGPSETETRLATLVDPLAGLPEIAVEVPTSEPATSVDFTPDGLRVAVGRGSEVLVFETESGRRAATLGGYSGRIASVLFTPDGSTLIASGGRPGMFGAVAIWDLGTGERRHDLRGHDDAILAAALSPDGNTLATAGYDGNVLLWDVRSGEVLRTLKEHTDAVYDVAFSPDGASLATASGDRTVKVWDVATGKRRVSLSDATAEQYAVTFGPDGSRLFAGGVDRTIRAWRLVGDAGTIVGQVIAHEGPILHLVVGPDGEALVSAGEDRSIRVWELDGLTPRSALPEQPDWPLGLAVSPSGERLAVARYDGSLALLDPGEGRVTATLLETPGPEAASTSASEDAPKPELVRDPTLNPPSPRGATRGQTVRVVLSGREVHRAVEVVCSEPGIQAKIVETDEPKPDRLEVDFTIAPDARPGIHRFGVRTPLETPPFQPFAVSVFPEVERNESSEPDQDEPLPLPATLVGAIDEPGDIDEARFPAKAGEVVVVDVVARAIGSPLAAVLSILDADGRVLVESRGTGRDPDPTMAFKAPEDGTYTVRIGDAVLGGSGGHLYRVSIGALPLVTSISPLGVERGTEARITFDGVNLGNQTSTVLDVPPNAGAGTILPVAVPEKDLQGISPVTRSVVVAEGRQVVESGENNEPSGASQTIASPGGVSGRIEEPGDIDHYRFDARRGERWIIEVYGRRLGTEIDPVVEVLDERGRPVPRAVLRPVATTHVAFRDHGSDARNIRLTTWDNLEVGDYLLAGRELMRLTELPRNPDDDAIFWGLGIHRTNMGERVAFLETTPEHHPQGQAIQKVEIHPPGTTFPAGGAAPVTLNYRNDDGGPGFEGDARLTFDPPEDGTYLIRVEDARGFGGDGFGYHLAIRRPRPDFALSLSVENPNVRRGGATVVTANLRRIDGFDGPVDVTVEGLPPGITATTTRIEPGLYAADFLLMADESEAPVFSPTTWTVTGRAALDADSTPEGEIRHTIDPGGPQGGWITVAGEPNLKVLPSTDRVVIRPGHRVTMRLAVERRPPFNGRVPIDVRNLPLGVRVENIGLNGVLVTEEQTEREVSLYAEPWAEPGERTFFAVGRCEAAGTQHSSPPIQLVVVPGEASPVAAATAGNP